MPEPNSATEPSARFVSEKLPTGSSFSGLGGGAPPSKMKASPRTPNRVVTMASKKPLFNP